MIGLLDLMSILHTYNTIESLHTNALRPSPDSTCSNITFCPSDTEIALEMLGGAAAAGLNAVAGGVGGVGAGANPGVLIHLTRDTEERLARSHHGNSTLGNLLWFVKSLLTNSFGGRIMLNPNPFREP